jgi:IS605 OrfB family transposase
MKSCKSYTCLISGNNLKYEYLTSQLEIIQDLSWFIFNLKQRFGINWWFNQKMLYHQCRRMFPELNSKVIQNFCSCYFPKKGTKLPKKPINTSIFLDQSFYVEESTKTKYTNFWLKFHRRYFPLFGKKILRKINFKKIKMIQIYERNNKLYCKMSEVNEIEETTSGSNIIGCDVNYKRVVFSDNTFNNIKQLAHRKIEHKKHNQTKRNINNYTKDFLHKLTTQIADELQSKAIEVLVLEDLKNLRKSASRKLGKSKGKMINYIINSMPYGMFQNFLKYKCLDRGIRVEHINPAYTSKTCSRCSSRNTKRPRQEDFVCLDCGFKLNADLNGSRNIEKRYTLAQCATSDFCAG